MKPPIEMPNEIALEFIRTMLQPGEPTLGMWFGWNQPNSGDTVKLGSVYAHGSESFQFSDIFVPSDGITGSEGDPTWDDAKEFVKLCRKYKKDPKRVFTLTGLFSADEVFLPYGDLDLAHQMLYRLMVMSVNTGGEQHNWSIEFGEMLASNYAERKSATCEWELYEGDDNFTIDFCDKFSHLLPKFDLRVEDREDPTYDVEKKVEPELKEWLEEYVDKFPGDFYLWMFGVQSDKYAYWRSEVNTILAWFIDWIQENWLEEYLTLTAGSPSDKLNMWLKWVETQSDPGSLSS